MPLASPALQSDIQSTLELYPPDRFVGMSMGEAVDYVNSRFAETREEPKLVKGTNGEWAYSIYSGVYFEYPSSWYVKVYESPYGDGYVRLIPSTDSQEDWNTGVTTFEAWEISDPARPFDLHREIDYVNAKWEQAVRIDGREGYYFSYDPSRTGLFRKLESILYDPGRNIKVRVTVMVFSPDEVFFDSNAEEARQKYEYLFHITESVRFRQDVQSH
jgi:hypothetical protein